MSVLCVGQLVADIVVRPVDAMPNRGSADRVEELKLLAGGCAANTACVLAKLGVDVSIAGLIGRDSLGDVVLADVASCGVNVSTVQQDVAVPTSAVVVMVGQDAERSFLYREGGNERLTYDMIDHEAIRKADFVHIGGAMKLFNFDLAAFLTKAKEFGCTTSIDTDWDVSGSWLGTLKEALPKIDYFLTNVEEGRMLTGSDDPYVIGKTLLSYGPHAVIIKQGALGAIAMTCDIAEKFPTFDVCVIDTTCAGDSFAAGFLFGLVRGWDITRSVRFANAVGALCTTQISHRGIVSLSAVIEFIQTQTGDTI